MKNKNGVKKNLIYNLLYNFVKITFQVVSFSYVSRILGAEALGQVNFSVAFVDFFLLLSCYFGVSVYAIREGIKLREQREELSQFASSVFLINLCTTIISCVVLYLFILFNNALRPYSSLLMIYSLTVSVSFLGIDWIHNIFESFKYIAIRNIILYIMAFGMLFLLVKDEKDSAAYIFVLTFIAIGHVVVNLFTIPKYVDIRIGLGVSGFTKHFKPIMVIFISSIASSIYLNSDIVMLGFMKGDVSVGLYSTGVKIYRILLHLIEAVNVVAFPRISRRGKENYSWLYQLDLCVLFPIAVGVITVREELILLFVGEEYIPVIHTLVLIGIILFLSTVNNCLANQFVLPNQEDRRYLLATTLGCVFNIILNFLLIPRFSYDGAAIATIVAELIVFLCFIQRCFKQKYIYWELGSIKYLIISLLFVVLGNLINLIPLGLGLRLVIKVILCMLIYGSALWITKDVFWEKLMEYHQDK